MSVMNYSKLIFVCLLGLISSQLNCQVINISKSKKGYQYVDYRGKKLSKIYFESAKKFIGIESMAAVKLEGKWGFVNQDIEIVIEPQFENARSFIRDRAVIKKDSNYFLIDRSGLIKSSPYDSIMRFRNDFIVIKDSLFGLINKHDSIIVENNFEYFGGISDKGYLLKKNGKWGYFNENNFILTDDKLDFNWLESPPIFFEKCLEKDDVNDIRICSETALLNTVYQNIRYPENARMHKTQGTVIVGFEILTSGEIENIKILKGLENGCSEEAMRIVKEHLNKWARPAYFEGIAIMKYYKLPIKFKL